MTNAVTTDPLAHLDRRVRLLKRRVDSVRKFNPNHDDLGRFAGSSTSDVSRDMRLSDSKGAAMSAAKYILQQGFRGAALGTAAGGIGLALTGVRSPKLIGVAAVSGGLAGGLSGLGGGVLLVTMIAVASMGSFAFTRVQEALDKAKKNKVSKAAALPQSVIAQIKALNAYERQRFVTALIDGMSGEEAQKFVDKVKDARRDKKLKKFNPHHDDKGRFNFARFGTSTKAKIQSAVKRVKRGLKTAAPALAVVALAVSYAALLTAAFATVDKMERNQALRALPTSHETPAEAAVRMKHGVKAARVVALFLRAGTPGEKAAAAGALTRMGVDLKMHGLEKAELNVVFSVLRQFFSEDEMQMIIDEVISRMDEATAQRVLRELNEGLTSGNQGLDS